LKAETVTVNELITKLENATRGLIPSFSDRLSRCDTKHISVICDYIIALRSEIKLSDNYRQNILATLTALSKSSNKDLKDFTRQDNIAYLEKFRKEDSQDPKHKWIGTYNSHRIDVIKFFKWLNYPDIEPKKRPKPEAVQNIPKLRRLEKSRYDPSDMWNAEDNLIFLRYCPHPRDRCYHAMEWDCSTRPHEILKLRIKDIEFIEEEGGGKYAKIVVNGKTGERPLALIDSIPYVTHWLSLHPQGSNQEAILLPNLKTGKAVQVNAMFIAYRRHREYFTSLLSSENVPEEDKKKITKLLKKPWNPYVLRHSALTEKCGLLNSDSKLRQHAGWTASSDMHSRYVHFRGGESMDHLLKLKGIVKDDKRSVNILKPKICPNPNCHEPNKPDAQFCFKCNFIMSFEAHQKSIDERERKDKELHDLKDLVFKMGDAMKRHERSIDFLSNELKKYRDQFGSRALTDRERGKLREMKASIEALPDDD
jgi:integrase/recombinase XerD